ncbi:helix-turn-helix transcriptional regulator [Streptomyces sp. NPDC051563]|uniref:helix-turn-helix transcriptional regulator n=1 Tax=Streptomyces sp. NPDC051563 TaxID=3365659 RepID=UPI0037B339DD
MGVADDRVVAAMRRARDVMDRGFADAALDVSVVAQRVGYSRFHFIRAFDSVYGQTPGRARDGRRVREGTSHPRDQGRHGGRGVPHR